MQYAIEAQELRRTYQRTRLLFRKNEEITAVDGVSLAIEPGIVYGLLGPNGAGKTTTIKMLSTLLLPTSGNARVAGFDVVRQEREVRRRLGVVLGGDRGLYWKLSARDNLAYFAHLYGMPRRSIAARVDELLETVGLLDRAADRVEGFSRGMKQRLHLAKALLHDPPVIFLDEPTIGLDPAAAITLRRIVQSLVPEHTVLLTTHYLHEADELCARIAIIDHGKVIVEDTPAGIKRAVNADQRYLVRARGGDRRIAGALHLLPSIRDVTEALEEDGIVTYTLSCRQDAFNLDAALQVFHQHGAYIDSFRALDLTLEDAFLALTEHPAGVDTEQEAQLCTA